MKVVIPWICVFGLLVGCFFLYATVQENQKELTQRRAESEELQKLRSEAEELRKLQVEHQELVKLRNDNEELLRLRNEVGQLRKQNKQLLAELQAAQAQSSQALQQHQTSTQLAAENEALRVQNQQFQQAQADLNTKTCLNNLRRIDDIKQLWALENKRPIGSLPTAVELTPYFPGGIFPVCPGGGSYTINAIGVLPTCNVPGHVMPKTQ